MDVAARILLAKWLQVVLEKRAALVEFTIWTYVFLLSFEPFRQ